MSTSDLRPGDRVKVLAAAYDEFVVFIGKIGTVDHVWSEYDVGVSIDGEPSGTTYSFAEHELKRLITTPSAVNQVTGKK